MEIIDFKVGPQIISGPIVRDVNGLLWRVLKNIGYASAQPKEGTYYTRYIAPPVDYSPQIKTLSDKVDTLTLRVAEAESISSPKLHESDFKIEVDEMGNKKLRIIR